MKITDIDAKEFARAWYDELHTQEQPPTLDECVVIGFLECRQRVLEGLKERFKEAADYADKVGEYYGLVGAAFQKAITDLEHGNGQENPETNRETPG